MSTTGNEKALEKMLQELEEDKDYFQRKKRKSSVPLYSYDVVDQLYRAKIKHIDQDLRKLQPLLKPQASKIYYERKVEMVNLLAEQHKLDNMDIMKILKQTESKKDGNQALHNLKKLMVQYNIKHPLRGEAFKDCPQAKQNFSDKIQHKASEPKSFLKYKTARRATLDQSVLQSEDYLRAEQEKFRKERMILRYRLFGKDGVSDFEFQQLVDMKIIKQIENPPIPDYNFEEKSDDSKTSQDKRDWLEEIKRRQEEAKIPKYEDNSVGDPIYKNKGFRVKLLDPKIFDKEQVREQLRRRRQKKFQKQKMTLNNQSDMNVQYQGKATFLSPILQPNAALLDNLTGSLVDTDIDQQSMNDEYTSLENIQEINKNQHNNPFNNTTQNQFPSIKVLENDNQDMPIKISNSNISTESKIQENTFMKTKTRYDGSGKTPMFGAKNTGSRNAILMPHLTGKFDKSHVKNVKKQMNSTLQMPEVNHTSRGSFGNRNLRFGSTQFGFMNKRDSTNSHFTTNQLANTTYDPEQSRSKTVTKRRPSPQAAAQNYPGDSKMKGLRTLMADSKKTAHSTTMSAMRSTQRNSPRVQFKTIELPVHKQRKDQSTGRINSMFTSKTPHLKDADIKQLVAKFPVGDEIASGEKLPSSTNTNSRGEKDPAEYSLGLRHVLGKDPEEANGIPLKTLMNCIETINRNCDTIDRKSQEYYKDMLTKFVTQDIRDDELMKIVDLLKDIDFAEPEQLRSTYEYKENDIKEKLRSEIQVAHDFHSGKFDPIFKSKRSKKKK